MTKYKYGIKSFKISDIDPDTGGPLAGTTVDIKEAIYRDTFDLTEEQGATTDHYSEMATSPKKRFRDASVENIVFSLMESNVEMLALTMGGEVVTVDTRKTWSKPESIESVEKHMEIETTDGTIVTIPRADVVGSKNFQFRRNNIWLIPVSATPLQPEFDGLASIDISEPV